LSFCIKQGDRSPAISSVLEATGLDLTGASVKFVMRLPGSTDDAKVNATATVVSATDCEVEYSWGATDTSDAGLYIAEWVVTFESGIVQTFPPNDYLYVLVREHLGFEGA
jgi:hypothetical protein